MNFSSTIWNKNGEILKYFGVLVMIKFYLLPAAKLRNKKYRVPRPEHIYILTREKWNLEAVV